MTSLAPVMQAFFTDKLIRQRNASPHTIRAYRDTFRLLLAYAHTTTGTQPSQLSPLAPARHHHDHRVPRASRNQPRQHRPHPQCQARGHPVTVPLRRHWPPPTTPRRSSAYVLAICGKRTDTTIISFLDEDESQALLAACDQQTWIGRRDRAMLLLALRAGLRVSELTALTCGDIQLGAGAHVRCTGKGRKERARPLLKPGTAAILRAWLDERGDDPRQPAVLHPPADDRCPLTR